MISIFKYFEEVDNSNVQPSSNTQNSSPTTSTTPSVKQATISSNGVKQSSAQTSNKSISPASIRTPLNINKPANVKYKPITQNPFIKNFEKSTEKKEDKFKPLQRTASLLGPAGYQ